MTTDKTVADEFLEDKDNLRLFQQEKAIYRATEAIEQMLEKAGVTRSQLATLLGRTKGRVTQILDSESNLTVRTIADIATVLGYEFCFLPVPLKKPMKERGRTATIQFPSKFQIQQFQTQTTQELLANG